MDKNRYISCTKVKLNDKRNNRFTDYKNIRSIILSIGILSRKYDKERNWYTHYLLLKF